MKISLNNGRTYTNNIDDIDNALATMGYDYRWLVSVLLPFSSSSVCEKIHGTVSNEREWVERYLATGKKDIAV